MNTIKSEKRWCLWKLEWVKGKLNKVPYQIDHTRAKSNNPKTWATFDQANAVYEQNKQVYNGIGLFFSDSLCGIDVDGSHDPDHKERNPLETEVLAMFSGTYQETSPSGNGDHILFRVDPARVPYFDNSAEFKRRFYMKNPNNDLEFYAGALTHRFFTFTGNRISTGDVVTDQTDAALAFLDKYMQYMRKSTPKRKTNNTQAGASLPAPVAADQDPDAFIADRLNKARNAKNGEKFIKLYDGGDIEAYNNDDSVADQALCAMLAFWLNGDPELMDRAFRGSALYREKWDRDDYSRNTIAKAIDICTEVYQEPGTTGRPGRPTKPRLTLADFDAILQNIGFSVRYNVITGRYDTAGRTPEGRIPSLDDLTTYLQDLLADDYKSVSIKLLEQYVVFLGREHQYNPVLEWLQTVTWDGVDRIQQVYDLLGITDDELSKTLVYKWLLQAVALLFNGESDQKPFGADGCLTLKGEQGCGKTSFFRHIGLQWFGEGKAIDNRDKDTKRRVVTKWITELGEVETTLKSDIEDLKNFISAREDEYRLPYGRSDVLQPRRASMCATCNSDRYLIDTTGNRRWWTVPINRMIPWKDINALDAAQLWAQIYATVAPLSYDQKGDCFRLTEDEQNQLAIRNGDYEKPSKGQDEVADILARADRDGLRWQEMTISEFKSLWPVLHPYGSGVIGTALKRCGITSRHTKRGNFAELPVPYTNADL